ncbi:hypothetical protein D1007_43121 [Hordeum vulgare]|nr:hypothetical protein D1007_43121 [Hordeum vulgare]
MIWYDDVVKYHVPLRLQWTKENIASLQEDDSEDDAYHDSIRELKVNLGTSGMDKRIFYGSDALSCDHGTEESESKLRGTVKKFMTRCRKLVGMIGCASSGDAHVSGGSMRTLASSSHAGGGSSSHVASSSRIVEEVEEEDDEEEEDEEQAGEEGEGGDE